MNIPALPKKLNAPEFARLFVTRCLAQHLAPSSLKAALDAATLWRGLRAEYAEYAAHQDIVVVRPDDAAHLLPEGVWAGLKPEKRKELRNLITKEAAQQRQVLAAVRRFIDAQCAALEVASPAFKEAYNARLKEYSTPAKPRPARRVAAAPTPSLLPA